MDPLKSQSSMRRPTTHSVSNRLETTQATRSTPWFEDGNVVLETEMTQFKVYRGILATNSVIFSDMFAVGQPGTGGQVEGCPVVHLADKADDLRYVLDALHEVKRWTGDDPGQFAPMPIPILAAFLRLGRKYEIEHLRKHAYKRLLRDFSPRLECTLDSDTLILAVGIENWGKSGDLLTLVNILRENDLLLFLPAALFKCVSRAHRGIFSLFYSTTEIAHPILSMQDIQLCVQASQKIYGLQATQTFSWLHIDDPRHHCSLPACAAFKKILCQELLIPPAHLNPFCLWDKSWEAWLCGECVSISRARHNEGRQNVWDQLPLIFGLPDWEELRLKWSTVRPS